MVLPFISDDEAEKMFAAQGGFRKVRSVPSLRPRPLASHPLMRATCLI